MDSWKKSHDATPRETMPSVVAVCAQARLRAIHVRRAPSNAHALRVRGNTGGRGRLLPRDVHTTYTRHTNTHIRIWPAPSMYSIDV